MFSLSSDRKSIPQLSGSWERSQLTECPSLRLRAESPVANRVDAESIVAVVVEMLVGKEWLLDGFSQFLPPSCR